MRQGFVFLKTAFEVAAEKEWSAVIIVIMRVLLPQAVFVSKSLQSCEQQGAFPAAA